MICTLPGAPRLGLATNLHFSASYDMVDSMNPEYSMRCSGAIGWGLVALAALAGGCRTYTSAPYPAESGQRSLPIDMIGYYDHPAVETPDRTGAQRTLRGCTVQTFDLPLKLPDELQYLRNATAADERDTDLWRVNRVELYLPDDADSAKPLPVVLVSPITGGNMIVDSFARYYARNGFAAVLVHRKRPVWQAEHGVQHLEDYLRSNIIRLRQTLEWIEQQERLDAKRIGALGISYGGIMHSVLAAVDERVQFHVLMLSAGPLPDVLITCRDGQIRRQIKAMLENNDWDKAELHGELAKVIRTDPMRVAGAVDSERMLVYTAAFDRVVGAENSRRLWRAQGRPQRVDIFAGHYGGALILPILKRQTLRVFRDRL
jgi:hypothetical protein